MKRWFGIGGFAEPDREQIYAMCFAMGLSERDAGRYLQEGIHEPSFQVNDYREVIFAYGLENHKTYEECLEMMEELEIETTEITDFLQGNHTNMLFEEFQEKKNMAQEEFQAWLRARFPYFKGYSKTALGYFEKYKTKILEYIREDAAEELERLLAETDYAQWSKTHAVFLKNPRQKIRKYLSMSKTKRRVALSGDIQKNILEQMSVAYSKLEANTRLLSVVYPSGALWDKARENGIVTGHTMNSKRLSDLQNVAVQKERYFHVLQAKRRLSRMSPQESCPAEIVEMVHQYERNKQAPDTAGQGLEWSKRYLSEHRRRCVQVQRNDLLPMILFVAQRKYLEEIQYRPEKYNRQDALTVFEDMANATLTACSMETLSEQYAIDCLLKHCYQKEEMYSYCDLLEQIAEG
jgi:hypothetical protein